MSTLFKSNAVAHSDEELLQHSAILHEVLAECPESFLQLFLTSTLTLLRRLPSDMLRFLRNRRFPARFKSAQLLPLLKKAGLDRSSPANYRLVSNLSTVSKVLERLVLARLRPHLTNSANFSKWQSAYRQGHSTETALVDVLESVYTAADNNEVTVLIGLDLSAAFDTVCHSILT